MNLAALVSSLGQELASPGSSKKVILFSYGSGALASMFSVIPKEKSSTDRFSLQKMQQALNLSERLDARTRCSPLDLNKALESREASHGVVPFTPIFSRENLLPGTFYLKEITSNYERLYDRH